ncbi:hypothetical protein BKA62DRAFT_827084 [Auriculariales sp. MPI-PUGE-AT-0066]|nr:hypothetical protein BKA62DRAFT_827084 [Auriculariales sp. MPI-PUGE-AT-0066]
MLVFPLVLWLGRLVTVLMTAHIGASDPDAVLSSGGCLPKLNFTLVTISAAIALSFDFTVIVTVIARCHTLWRQSLNRALLSLLLRDGLIYFGIVACANVVNTIVMQKRMDAVAFGIIMMITTTIPAIMVYRMILGLRTDANGPISESDQTSTTFSEYNELSNPNDAVIRALTEESV